MTAQAAQAVRGRAGAGLIVFICFLIAAVEGFDIQAFGVAAPKLAPDLGLDPSQQGWAASAAMIGLVIGAVLGGWFADRVGRKPVLLVSVAMFGVFSIVTAVSQGYDALLWARFLTGLGFGGAMPNLIAIATEISAPNRRAATVTMMFCGMPAGGACVSLLARLMGDDLAWRTVFMIGGVAPLILVPLIFFLLPETRPERKEGADRSTWRGLFGQGRGVPTLLLWVVFVMTLVVLYLMLNWLPTLVVAKGLNPAAGSSAALAFNMTGIAGALLLGFVVDRAGYRWPVTLTFLLLALAMGALAAAGQLTAVLVLSAVAGFLLLGAQYSLYAVIPSLYPPQVRAAGSGAAVAVGRLGSIAGPLVAGELRGAGYSAGQVFGVMIPVVLAAAAAVFALSWLARPHED